MREPPAQQDLADTGCCAPCVGAAGSSLRAGNLCGENGMCLYGECRQRLDGCLPSKTCQTWPPLRCALMLLAWPSEQPRLVDRNGMCLLDADSASWICKSSWPSRRPCCSSVWRRFMQSRHSRRLPCSVTAQGACRQPSSAQTSWWLRHRWGGRFTILASSHSEQRRGLAPEWRASRFML